MRGAAVPAAAALLRLLKFMKKIGVPLVLADGVCADSAVGAPRNGPPAIHFEIHRLLVNIHVTNSYS